MGVNSLTKTVTRQRRGCEGPSAPESSTLTTRLPSHMCVHRLIEVENEITVL